MNFEEPINFEEQHKTGGVSSQSDLAALKRVGLGYERGQKSDKLKYWCAPAREAMEQMNLSEEDGKKVEAFPIDRIRGISVPATMAVVRERIAAERAEATADLMTEQGQQVDYTGTQAENGASGEQMETDSIKSDVTKCNEVIKKAPTPQQCSAFLKQLKWWKHIERRQASFPNRQQGPTHREKDALDKLRRYARDEQPTLEQPTLTITLDINLEEVTEEDVLVLDINLEEVTEEDVLECICIVGGRICACNSCSRPGIGTYRGENMSCCDYCDEATSGNQEGCKNCIQSDSAAPKTSGEDHRVPQCEERVGHNVINVSWMGGSYAQGESKAWEWCDEKEATPGAHKGKNLAKYLVEYATRQVINAMRSVMYRWCERTVTQLGDGGRLRERVISCNRPFYWQGMRRCLMEYVTQHAVNIMSSVLYRWRARTVTQLKGHGSISERVISCNSSLAETVTPDVLRFEWLKTFLFNTGEYLTAIMMAHKLQIWSQHLDSDKTVEARYVDDTVKNESVESAILEQGEVNFLRRMRLPIDQELRAGDNSRRTLDPAQVADVDMCLLESHEALRTGGLDKVQPTEVLTPESTGSMPSLVDEDASSEDEPTDAKSDKGSAPGEDEDGTLKADSERCLVSQRMLVERAITQRKEFLQRSEEKWRHSVTLSSDSVLEISTFSPTELQNCDAKTALRRAKVVARRQEREAKAAQHRDRMLRCAPTKEEMIEAAKETTVDATAAEGMPDATVERATTQRKEFLSGRTREPQCHTSPPLLASFQDLRIMAEMGAPDEDGSLRADGERCLESQRMLVGSVNDSKLCPFAATFTPRAREGCTSKLRQEVSKLTGIPFSTGYFQRLEHLVAATRLMGRNVVVVVETENSCPMTGFHMPIRLTTGTVHELRRCIRRTHDTRLYWRTPTATVEVVTIMKSEMEGAEQGERTSVIYVDRAHKTPSHYEEFQGKLNSTEMSIILSRRGYLTGQYKAGQSMEERRVDTRIRTPASNGRRRAGKWRQRGR